MRAVCCGCLVLHRDGSVAFCTEELDGRPCGGYEHRHIGGTMPCRIDPRTVQCMHCRKAMQLRLMFAPPFEALQPERSPALVN